jgi:hypothetical protein
MSSFSQKAGLQGFIKKIITPEPLEVDNCFFFIAFLKAWTMFCAVNDIFFVSLN